MSTYVAIAKSDTIKGAAYKELGLMPQQRAHLNVSSELVPSTNIIKITVESADPSLAQACANLMGQKTIEYVMQLYEAYDMKPLDAAYLPRSPSKPDKTKNLMLGVILGAVSGAGLAFMLENLRSSKKAIIGANIMDGDTGIYNQYYFLRRLSEELSRARRNHYPLSMALVNVEQLDTISDMRLPRLRNEILRRVGLFFKQYLREEDLVARFEGDKFALLLPDTPASDAEQILTKLHTRLEWNTFELDESGIKLNLSATAGVVAYDFNDTSRDELIVKAKSALRRAGDNGCGPVYLFNEETEARQLQANR